MTKNYHICAKRDKHLPFDVFSGSSITQGCHVWHNCGSFLSFTPQYEVSVDLRIFKFQRSFILIPMQITTLAVR
jgi:hypothetical protein